MLNITDQEFEEIVENAWRKIPDHFRFEMDNVAIRIEKEPTREQLQMVRAGTLLGIFEGLPKTAWGQATMGTPPSKITLFQQPILQTALNINKLPELILEVLMHEVAHYFGYNDDDMFILDQKLRKRLSNN